MMNDDAMEIVFYQIKTHFMKWAVDTGARKFIVAVSGGKDSTVVLNLTAKIFGSKKVVGLIIPNGKMTDYEMAKSVCIDAGVEYQVIDISKAVASITEQIQDTFDGGPLRENANNNIPPRLRMTVAYAYAQCYDGGRVINTSNRSEAYVGWTTLWGDNVGDYAPIADLTCTEVQRLGNWLGIKSEYVEKTPSDGLCGRTDEEALGFTYEELDDYITGGDCEDFEIYKLIRQRQDVGKFKRKMVTVPRPRIFRNPVLYNKAIHPYGD